MENIIKMKRLENSELGPWSVAYKKYREQNKDTIKNIPPEAYLPSYKLGLAIGKLLACTENTDTNCHMCGRKL